MHSAGDASAPHRQQARAALLGTATCCALLLAMLPALPLAAAPTGGNDPGEPVAQGDYAVVPGDDCKSIAIKFWGNDKEGLDALHELNPQMGPQPHDLKPGFLVHVGTLPDARVTYLKPAVNKRPGTQPVWRPATRGDGLFRLDEVNTLKGAGAELTFKDKSSLALDENALIVVYGERIAPQKHQKSGAVELVKGDAEVKLSDLRGDKPMEVATPSAQVSLAQRSRAGIGVDPSKTSRVQVYSGQAEVSAEGKKVVVQQGYGTRVEPGKAPEQPAQLPTAPAWETIPPPTLFTLGAKVAPLKLAWKPAQRAARYHLLVARDPLFFDRAIDRWVEGGPAAAAPLSLQLDLPLGELFVRVQAVDGNGLTGPASSPLPILVVSVRPLTARMDAGKAGLRSAGELRVVIEGPPSARLAIDAAPPQELRLPTTVSLLAPGKHELHVGGAGALVTLPLEVSPPKAKVKFGPTTAGQPTPLGVRFDDGTGRALVLPNDEGGAPALQRLLASGIVHLRDGASRPVAASLDGDGLRGVLSPDGGLVRVYWAGAVIGEASPK